MSRNTFSNITSNDGLFVDGDWVESKDQDPNGDTRLIQLADIGDGYFLNKSHRFLTSTKAKELRCTYLKVGDILVARMPDPICRACVFPGLETPCVTVVDVCIIRPNPLTVNPNWLKYMINSPGFRSRITKYVTGTTRQRISRGNLSKLDFEVPTIDVQNETVRVLDEAGAIRLKRKESIRLLDDYLNSVFVEMFGDLAESTVGTRVEPLENVAEIRSGVTKGRKLNNNPTVEVPYMRVANVQDGRIDLNEVKTIVVLPSDVQKYRLEVGDLLLTEGGDPDKLGRGGVWKGEIENCIHQNHIFRVRFDQTKIIPEYASSLMSSPYGKRYFLRSAKQTTGIATINSSQLKKFPIPIPELSLQKKFADATIEAESIRKNMQIQELNLALQFQSLMQGAFKGPS